MKPKKTLYYSDPLRDDFSRVGIPSKPLRPDYDYAPSGPLWKAASFLLYRLVAAPAAYIVSRLWYGVRVYNRRALRGVQGGLFLYINHTQGFHDAYMPILLAWPRRNYVAVSPSAVSAPVLRTLVPLLGGIPVPDSLTGLRRFLAALETRIGQGACVTIYPEAHIWPYYTGVRPFSSDSFGYPVRMGRPVVAVATTYRQRRIFKNARPLIDVTVSEPYWPDPSLGTVKARQRLRDQVYDFLAQTTSAPENAAYFEYIERPSSP